MALVAVLSYLVCAPALAGPRTPSATLGVEGTGFVLSFPDGRVVRSPEMRGAQVFLALEGAPAATVRIASVTPDPAHADILRHEFEVQTEAGEWTRVCGPTVDGQTWGFPIVLPDGHPGRGGSITMACASGAIGKCVRFGYKPWARGPNGEDLTLYHAACVRLLRADYGGDGQGHTRDGTPVDLWDRLGLQGTDNEPEEGFAFEAGWGADGATCVARTRWTQLLSLDGLRAAYAGRFEKPCTVTEAERSGALLFNHSRLAP